MNLGGVCVCVCIIFVFVFIIYFECFTSLSVLNKTLSLSCLLDPNFVVFWKQMAFKQRFINSISVEAT